MRQNKANQDVRKVISDSGLYMWEVAGLLGVDPSTFTVWMRSPLSTERKQKILEVIREHTNGRKKDVCEDNHRQ